MTKTANNLAAAWQARADRADTELAHVKTGWALFRPERVVELIEQRNRALAEVRYWTGIGAS